MDYQHKVLTMAVSSPGPSRGRFRRGGCQAEEYSNRLLNCLDTRVARSVKSLLKSGHHRELLDLSLDPHSYSNADLFGRDLAAVSLLSKFPGLNTGYDLEQEALKSFRWGEDQCRQTNARFRAAYDTPTLGVSGESLIWEARRKISRLLGEFSWNDAIQHCAFTTGASVGFRRSMGDPFYKFSGLPETTRRAAMLCCCLVEYHPSWAYSIRERQGLDPVNWVRVVAGNKVAIVPKNAKTGRTIAAEPSGLMFVQKGIGNLLREKLVRVGVYLNDQTHNQRLACEGSIDGSFATLDLKGASDTVSYELVKALLPSDWFEAMDLVRSEFGTLPSGEIVRYQKFSSMGNAYTFELESLIFWALTSAVLELLPSDRDCRFAVYGDDLIVPTAAAGWLVELLSYCGFTTNERKSHTSGPYRESCGKHYFLGVDVTPIYVRKPIDSIARQYWFANAVRRLAGQCTDGDVADPRYFGVWQSVVDDVPRALRRFVPLGLGDAGFSATFQEALPRRRKSMWRVPGIRIVVGRNRRIDGVGALLRAMMYGGSESSLETIVVDRDKERFKTVVYETSQWHNAPYWPRFG